MKAVPTLPAAFLADGGERLPQPLRELRTARGRALQDMPLPTRKTENWKYSSRYLSFDEALAPALEEGTQVLEPMAVSGYRIVIRNGLVDLAASELPDQAGFRVTPFSELDVDRAQQLAARLDQALDTATTQLARLNTARLEDGVLVEVAAETEVDRPLYIQILTDAQQSGSVYPRIMLTMAERSTLTLVEQYEATDAQAYLVDAVTEADVGEGATLTYIRLALEPESVGHVGATGVRLAGGSHFESHCFGFGGTLRRHDLQVRFEAPGAHCLLNGVAVTQNNQHYDNHTVLEHIAANCTSEENYRCMAAGTSHSVFNGRIHIHRDAQKTSAQMNSKNLLLSPHASIDTKPELEIYADDVKCGHGATIGQLDPEAMFFLLSRGIDRAEARTLLSMGFINELVAQIPLEDVRAWIDERLAGFIQNNLIED
ncbi:Fe-S cluster assembly protein SufD [Stutzerimonas stutzeri]|uniref:Fe-S cluster assembly protein SufD n=1 Tax=Stutzerimonas stutzeri TaxID=316 RepID=UPI0002D60D29|nr:Fe-S cluster assembly protein SufD [Stutzerimonas stutzeri]